MSDREKLIELLIESVQDCAPSERCLHCKYMAETDCMARAAADHLIANGVTVQPVQVGDTVYGRFSFYGKEVHRCEVVKVKTCQFKDRTVRYFLDLEFAIVDPFFCDGRLMRCGVQAIYGEDWGDWYRVYLTREEAEQALKERRND